MKFLKGLLVTILLFVILIGGAFVGLNEYTKSKYEIDLFRTIGELTTLTKEVDESKLCTHAFSNEDMVDVQQVVNESVENLITYTIQNGFSVNFNNLPDEMKSIISLTDKQVGALAQTVLEQEMGGKISFAGKEIDVELKQIKFTNATAQCVSVNTVVAVDLTPFINEIPNEIPFTLFVDKIPQTLYVSSTVTIEKGANPFSYTVESESFSINNLSSSDTADLFRTIDVIAKVGNAQDWNKQIGEAIANALIGNNENKGLAYSLRVIGATTYNFEEVDGVICFKVLR